MVIDLAAALERLTGRPHVPGGPYEVRSERGGDPYIACWDASVLGPRPAGPAVEAAGLEAARDAACVRIDARAEVLRRAVLTPGAGQMAAYLAKETQARAFLCDGEPAETAYPDLYNEVGITAATPQDVAMAILTAAESCRAFGRAVEKTRLGLKKAVREAGDAAGVATAETAAAWPRVSGAAPGRLEASGKIT